MEEGEVKEVEEVKEVKEVEGVKEVEDDWEKAVGWMGKEICGFGEENMKEFSTKLAI